MATIPITAGFFFNDSVTPATVGDLTSAVAAASANISAAAASAVAAAASQVAAAASAVTASSAQSSATSSASTATTQASSATSSASAASTSATTATTQAGTATTQATNASASATAASSSSSTATTQATNATNSASAAASSASAASSSASAAAASAATVVGAFAVPGAIGSTTPNSGQFTTLAASSTVSGAGFDAYLASGKPAAHSTLSASSTVSGAGFDAYIALGTKPASFTTLAASGLISPTSTVGIAGTTTNDAVQAGSVGEILSCVSSNQSAVCTITIAAPGVVSYTGHGFTLGAPVTFTTTGALPTGLTAGAAVYVIPNGPNQFWVASTVDLAIAGTKITTSGSQSGTQTASGFIAITNAAAGNNIGGISLTAGDWEVWSNAYWATNTASAINAQDISISTISATIATGPGNGSKVGNVDTGIGALSGIYPLGSPPPYPIQVASTQTVYLVASATCTGNPAVFGAIYARRRR